jgi:hypothetical protein
MALDLSLVMVKNEYEKQVPTKYRTNFNKMITMHENTENIGLRKKAIPSIKKSTKPDTLSEKPIENASTISLKTANLHQIFGLFLSEQSRRLTRESFKDYIGIIKTYENYLKWVGMEYLDKEEQTKYDNLEKGEIKVTLLDVVGKDFLIRMGFGDFLRRYLPDMAKSKGKKTIMVFRKLVSFLLQIEFISEEDKKNYFEEFKDSLVEWGDCDDE